MVKRNWRVRGPWLAAGLVATVAMDAGVNAYAQSD